MISRSFRIGLRLGLLAGLIIAVAKALQARREAAAPEGAPSWDWSPPATDRAADRASDHASVAKPPAPRFPQEPQPEREREREREREPESAPNGRDAEVREEAEPVRPGLSLVTSGEEPAPPTSAAIPKLVVVPEPERDREEPSRDLDDVLRDLPEAPAGRRSDADPAEPTTPAKRAAGPGRAAPGRAAQTPSAAKAAPAAKTLPPTRSGRAAKTGQSQPPAEPTQVWVQPSGSVCPETHPVKAKLASKLFHLPGMFAYARTRPDRCYQDEQAAVADGLTRAKR